MPTRTLHIDGNTGVAAIIRTSAYWAGGNSPAITSPEYYPDDVFFHSSLNYLQPDLSVFNGSSVSVTFPQREIAYYTWADGSKGGCGGGCFITTAVCQSLGLPDDCYELQTLRKFRDEYMLTTADGREKVDWYYRHAPAIVQAIDLLTDREDVYQKLYSDFISSAVMSIWRGDNVMALSVYEQMINFAKSKVGT